MARTIAEGLNDFGEAIQQRRLLARQNQNDQLDRAIKLGELKTKGINITQQETPRKLFGFIPAGSQRSLSMSYDPTMNPSYAKDQSVIAKNKAQTEQALAKASSLGKDDGLTIGQRTARDKAVTDIYATREANKVKRGTLDKAIEGAEKVPSGFMGKMQIGAKKFLGSKDPMLKDAQELKMALTQGTLAETAHTKGAISDSEMMLFKEASANDDFNSPAVQPVLEKMRAFLDAEEAGQSGAYQRNYGEDPNSWFQEAGGNSQIGKIVKGADGKDYRIIGGDPNDPDVEPV